MASAWTPIVSGFEGNIGSEGGQVRVDEEHAAGARITLEEGGGTAPWAITCGIYGTMFHTAFFGTEVAAREALAGMKERIEAILAATEEGRVALIEQLVTDF